jgi:DNA-binding transcriptional MocR family regulator
VPPITASRSSSSSRKAKSSGFPFLDSLVPSYLSVDTDGRVLRLDTFSKTVAPGCRLGWITAQPAIIERILRITETSTQQPSGFVQAVVAQMIMGPQQSESARASRRGGKGAKRAEEAAGWEVDGWVRWLEGLRGEYERRMNSMCCALEGGKYTVKQQRFAHHAADPDDEWAVVSKVRMYDFGWPRAGMFVWLRFELETHPLFGAVEATRLARALWIWLTRAPYLVLAAPGEMFSPTAEIAEKEGWRFVRLCFAAVEEEEVGRAAERFARGVEAFWHLRNVSDLDGIEEESTAKEVDENVTNLGGAWAC